ncbi:MAG: type VI secretion system tip protein TssI/VgrG [Desulfosarcinaceae bacterium]
MTTFDANPGNRLGLGAEEAEEILSDEQRPDVHRSPPVRGTPPQDGSGPTRLRDITPDGEGRGPQPPDPLPLAPPAGPPGGMPPGPAPGGFPSRPTMPASQSGLRAMPEELSSTDSLDRASGASDTRTPRADTERFVFTAAGIRFSVVDFVARQSFSRLFEVDLNLALEEVYPLDEILGSGGALVMDLGECERYFNGIVSRFEQTGTRGRYRLFRARLVPQVWLLSLEQDCRIFQDKDVLEIIREVIEGAGLPRDSFRFSTRNTYARRAYCVQYRESHLDFITRLAEEEGIYFFFEHEHRRHTLVFGEGDLAFQPVDGESTFQVRPMNQMVAEEEVLFELDMIQQLQTSKVTLRDFDFKRPSLNLTAETNGSQPQQDEQEQRTFEWFDYPGCYNEPGLGRRFAEIRLQERVKNRETVRGTGNCCRFLPGFTFAVECHDCDEANQEYALVEVVHEGKQPQVLGEQSAGDSGFSYINRFTAIPARVPYVPERRTPRPRITGVQTARVTGPHGEAIHTDQYGRVKVRFHWDRSDSHDENASCWVRVSQLWAGASWGAMFLPRVGQEVIVEFEEGDPDRPIITGRVYNGAAMPPYTLPEERSKSTIKSDSLSGSGFNELRFDDTGDNEEIFLHAQKDFNQVVENNMLTRVRHDQMLDVENDRSKTVQNNEVIIIQHNRSLTVSNDETHTVQANRTTEVGQNEDVTINGGRRTRIARDEVHEVAANRSVNATGNQVLQANANTTVEAGGDLLLTGNSGAELNGPTVRITAAREIVLGVGANQIRLTSAGIEINGVQISSEARTINEIKGLPVKINC